MPDLPTIAAVLLVFLLAGSVKGVIGLGLPTVSLSLLTIILDLPSAMVLLLVPSFVTNLWQALVGGHTGLILRRLWFFFLMSGATVWLGALALTRVGPDSLSALLGVLLAIYGGVSLAGFQLALSARQEFRYGPVLGAINGVLTGMTGSFGVPGIMFLQAIGLPRVMLIQAMGMLFTISSFALALALQSNRLISLDLGALSAAAVLPALLGMWAGARLGRRLSEQRFRRVFFYSMLLIGLYIIAHAVQQ